MRTVVQSLIFLAAILLTAPARAELYKWVDERGVTNYSNAPPAAAAPANKLTRVENTISVYTPDESFMQAVKIARERSIQALAEPEPQRSAVGRVAVSSESGYEQCVSSGRLGCDDLYRAYSPAYYPAVAAYPLYGVRPVRINAPRPAPYRTTATRVVRASSPR
jgi:hypothetical protein